LLKDVVSATGLEQDSCASLLGIDPKLFNEWVMGQRPMPEFLIPQLSTVFGVSAQDLVSAKRISDAPAIWYKLRDSRFVPSDRESIVLIRNLGFFFAQLQDVTKSKNVLWKALFEQIRTHISKQASPSDQGRLAARLYRSARNLSHGARGIGMAIRENLRGTGLLLIETPLPKSNIEGCSFYVGQTGSDVPCLFANTYGTTWFRRNLVLMHELGHALFDLESEALSVDYKGEEEYSQLQERRAQAFALEMLVPMEVLRHIQTSNGFKWHDLKSRDLALIVAGTDVEAGTAMRAAWEAGFIDEQLYAKYSEYQIWDDLRQLTPRALSTKEFLRQTIGEQSIWPANKRTTTISSLRLRLPVTYVKDVLTAACAQDISLRKAAEMLMIDKDTLVERFAADLGVGK